MGQAGRGAQRFAVLEPAELGGQRGLLTLHAAPPARRRRGAGATARPPAAGRRAPPRCDAPAPASPAALVAPAVVVQQFRDVLTGEPVQRRPLLGRPQQMVLVRLAGHRELRGEDVGEHGRRNRPATDERPGTSLRRDGAGHQQRVVVVLRTRLECPLGGRAVGGQQQSTLDQGARRLDAHLAAVGTTTSEKVNALEHHRLAGPGLASDHGESAREREHGVVDDAEAHDVQFLEHGRTVGRSSDRIGAARRVVPRSFGTRRVARDSPGVSPGVAAVRASRRPAARTSGRDGR